MTSREERPSDEALRQLYQETMTGRGPGCPEPEELAGLATGAVDGAERARLADHVVGCRSCAEDYRDLMALAAEADRPDGVASAVTSAAPRSRWALAAAATLVLAVSVPFVWRTLSPPEPGDAVLRGAELTDGFSPSDRQVLAAPPELLDWSPLEVRGPFHASLFDERAELIWKSGPIVERRVTLPAEIRDVLQPGRAYFWLVETAGVRRLSEGPFWFSIEE